MGRPLRTRKTCAKISAKEKKKERPPTPPPPSSSPPPPVQKAVTNHPSPHLARAPRPGQEGGGKQNEGGLPLNSMAPCGYAKSWEPRLHPPGVAQWLKSFSVLGCGPTCPPLPPPPRGAGKDTWRGRPLAPSNVAEEVGEEAAQGRGGRWGGRGGGRETMAG